MRYLFSFLCLLSFFASHGQTYPKMVTVQDGTFIMGDTTIEDATPHKVSLSTFKISQTPVTVAQYRAYCKEAGVKMPTQQPTWRWQNNHPMVFVSAYRAEDYAAWLAKKTGKKYRLPTEAEWEYAARGGRKNTGKKYAGSDSLDLTSWHSRNSKEQTQPVALKAPNELGIYDMSGNVWEWCADRFEEDYYLESELHNPKGPKSNTRFRSLRGGGWAGDHNFCHVAYRNAELAGMYNDNIGFRVVQEL